MALTGEDKKYIEGLFKGSLQQLERSLNHRIDNLEAKVDRNHATVMKHILELKGDVGQIVHVLIRQVSC